MPNAACHYCGPYVRGHVHWTHEAIDVDRHTCYHCGRTRAHHMRANGWIRVTEDEWLHEENRLTGAL